MSDRPQTEKPPGKGKLFCKEGPTAHETVTTGYRNYSVCANVIVVGSGAVAGGAEGMMVAVSVQVGLDALVAA